MILAVMGAGVVTVFVKNDTTTTPTAQAPDISSSTPLTTEPAVAPTPTSSVDAARQLAARSGVKRAPKGRQVPLLPDSGVGGHPIGVGFVVLGCALAVWVRRATHA